MPSVTRVLHCDMKKLPEHPEPPTLQASHDWQGVVAHVTDAAGWQQLALEPAGLMTRLANIQQTLHFADQGVAEYLKVDLDRRLSQRLARCLCCYLYSVTLLQVSE